MKRIFQNPRLGLAAGITLLFVTAPACTLFDVPPDDTAGADGGTDGQPQGSGRSIECCYKVIDEATLQPYEVCVPSDALGAVCIDIDDPLADAQQLCQARCPDPSEPFSYPMSISNPHVYNQLGDLVPLTGSHKWASCSATSATIDEGEACWAGAEPTVFPWAVGGSTPPTHEGDFASASGTGTSATVDTPTGSFEPDFSGTVRVSLSKCEDSDLGRSKTCNVSLETLEFETAFATDSHRVERMNIMLRESGAEQVTLVKGQNGWSGKFEYPTKETHVTGHASWRQTPASGGQSVDASLELGGKEGFGSIDLVQGEMLFPNANLRRGQLRLSLFAEGFASAEQDLQVELSASLEPYRSKHE